MDVRTAAAVRQALFEEQKRYTYDPKCVPPRIVELRDSGGKPLPLYERINVIKDSGNCGSTNYLGMHQAMIQRCKQFNVPDDEKPVCVVYTDGDFDTMVTMNEPSNHQTSYYSYSRSRNDYTTRDDFNTTHTNVIKLWKEAGYSGPPVICYWNLKNGTGRTTGHQAKASDKGVFELSGASPSNIRYVIYGETAEDIETEVMIDGKMTKVKTKNVDAMTIFRKAMDQNYFNTIREIIGKSSEGVLKYYTFS